MSAFTNYFEIIADSERTKMLFERFLVDNKAMDFFNACKCSYKIGLPQSAEARKCFFPRSQKI